MGKRLFQVFGESEESKFFVRNPEEDGERPAEPGHLIFQAAEPAAEDLLCFVAFEDGLYTALNQQGGFLPSMLDQVSVDFDFFADDSQEIRNLGIHPSDPEVDMLWRYGFFGIPRFLEWLAGIVFLRLLRLEISRFLRVISSYPFLPVDSFEEGRNREV